LAYEVLWRSKNQLIEERAAKEPNRERSDRTAELLPGTISLRFSGKTSLGNEKRLRCISLAIVNASNPNRKLNKECYHPKQ
jgi:hypothetical protein